VPKTHKTAAQQAFHFWENASWDAEKMEVRGSKKIGSDFVAVHGWGCGKTLAPDRDELHPARHNFSANPWGHQKGDRGIRELNNTCGKKSAEALGGTKKQTRRTT